MKNCVVRAERNAGEFLYLCNTWGGKLTWTFGTDRRMILTPVAADSMMIVIRNIVPENWNLEVIEVHKCTPFVQDAKYYIENLPNV